MSKRKASPHRNERVALANFNTEKKQEIVQNYIAMNEMMAKAKETHAAETKLIITTMENYLKQREEAWK